MDLTAGRASRLQPKPSDSIRLGRAPQLEIVDLPEADHREACDLLALAFRDSPINRAVIRARADRRLASNRAGMQASFRSARDEAIVLAARDSQARLAGVLMALEPGRFPLPRPPLFDQLVCLFRQGSRVTRRWGQVYDALFDVHPTSPHWYLALLGVDQARQGIGIGSALLMEWLKRVDASSLGTPSGAESPGALPVDVDVATPGPDSLPVYLETDRAENLLFYQRAGFRVLGEHAILGVPVWQLWRDPPSSAARHCAS